MSQHCSEKKWRIASIFPPKGPSVYPAGGVDLLVRRWVSIGTIAILILLVTWFFGRRVAGLFERQWIVVLWGSAILWATVRQRGIGLARQIILGVVDSALVAFWGILFILAGKYTDNEVLQLLYEYPSLSVYLAGLSLVAADMFMAKIVLPAEGKVLEGEDRNRLAYGPVLLLGVASAAIAVNILLAVLAFMPHSQSGTMAAENTILAARFVLVFSIAVTAPLIWFIFRRQTWTFHTTWVLWLLLAVPFGALGFFWFVLIVVALSDEWTTALRGKPVEEKALASIRTRMLRPLTGVASVMIACAGLGVWYRIHLIWDVIPAMPATAGLSRLWVWLPLGLVGLLYVVWERVSLRSTETGLPEGGPDSGRRNEGRDMGREMIGVILTGAGGLGFILGLPMLLRGISMAATPGRSGLDGDIDRFAATRELFGGLIACMLFGLLLAVGIWFLQKNRKQGPPLTGKTES